MLESLFSLIEILGTGRSSSSSTDEIITGELLFVHYLFGGCIVYAALIVLFFFECEVA